MKLIHPLSCICTFSTRKRRIGSDISGTGMLDVLNVPNTKYSKIASEIKGKPFPPDKTKYIPK